MKRCLLAMLVSLCAFTGNAQSTIDTTTQKEIKEILRILKDTNRKVTPIQVATPDAKKTLHVLGFWEWIMVFAPLVLLVIIILFVVFGLGKKFDLAAALAENELPKVVIPNKEYTAKNIELLKDKPEILSLLTPTVEVSLSQSLNTCLCGAALNTELSANINVDTTINEKGKNPPSISRLIALLSGLLIIVVGVCLTSLFIYEQIRTEQSPDLSKLSGVLIALGLGITPYVANKVSGAIAARSSNQEAV